MFENQYMAHGEFGDSPTFHRGLARMAQRRRRCGHLLFLLWVGVMRERGWAGGKRVVINSTTRIEVYAYLPGCFPPGGDGTAGVSTTLGE